MHQVWLMIRLTVLALSMVSFELSAQEEPGPKGLLDRIAERTKQQVESAINGIDSAVMTTAGGAIGTAVASLEHEADDAIRAGGAVAEEAVSDMEKGIQGLFTGGIQNRLREQLSRGRVVLPDVRFVGFTPDLEPASEQTLEALARALTNSNGIFLIGSHTDRSDNPAADQRLSEVRASLVKAKLIAAGVPADRLVSAGFGSSQAVQRAAPGASVGSARIEVARIH